MIIQCISAKEGVGGSTIASNFAVVWQQVTRQRVLVVDFDQGDQSLFFGLKSKKTLKDLADFSKTLDVATWSLFAGVHKSGVHILSHAGELVSSVQLSRHFDVLRTFYDLIILDVGKFQNPLSDFSSEIAHGTFLVVSQDPLVALQCKKTLDHLLAKLISKETIFVLLNKYSSQNPYSLDILKQQIQMPFLGIFPEDTLACLQGLLRSQLVAQGQNIFSKSFLEFSQKLYQTNVLKNLTDVKKTVSIFTEVQKKEQWTSLKERVHKGLVEEIDLKKIGPQNDEEILMLKEKTKKLALEIIQREDTKKILQNKELLAEFLKEVLNEALGLGPLEDLLKDKNISEIMVVGAKKIYYEQNGKIKMSAITFTSDRQAINVIERIVAPIGRRIDEKTPYVDARLRDGSRVHAIIPPCAIDGPTITIRKFPLERLNYKKLIEFGSLTEEMADFLRIAVEAHKNIVVSGGTGSGKTTLINILGSFIPVNERIITCEDSAELNLPQEHVIRLETRPANLEGDGAIDIRTLVKQTLRMRPDRIIVGECRGGEALDMLQAMNTGHEGSLTTVHSNTPRDCVARLETLVQYAGANLTTKGIKEMVASAVHLIVQQSRMDDGSRKITNITEVVGMQNDVITLQDIFVFKQVGIDAHGKIQGKFQGTGFIPTFVEKLERKGYRIPRGIFKIA